MKCDNSLSLLIHIDNRFQIPREVTFNCSVNTVKSFPVYPLLISYFSSKNSKTCSRVIIEGTIGIKHYEIFLLYCILYHLVPMMGLI